MKKQLKIDGMRCEHCQKRVESALSPFGAVCVDLSAKTATVACDVEDAILKEEIESLGFDVLEIVTL